MTTYDDLLSRVMADPEDDEARLSFAAHIRASEPARAEFIDVQVAEARRRRASRDYSREAGKGLLAKHEGEWTRTMAKYAREWVFDRGFVTQITIDPHIFLEHGKWLFVIAPIRSVAFTAPSDGPFPSEELAASPLLSHLDAITFKLRDLTTVNLKAIAASSHIERLLVVSDYSFGTSPVTPPDPGVYEAFAASTRGRHLLFLNVGNYPGEISDHEDDGSLPPAGRALEARYGYLPWLHAENRCERFDAAYYVTKGVLPVNPNGR